MKAGYLIIQILLISSFAFGKTINIKGKVFNDKKEALQYVNIGIVNKTIGTVSNIHGKFHLIIEKEQISKDDTLRFSMVGYKARSFPISEIKNKDSLNVQLLKKIEIIPEAIVMAPKLKTKVQGTKHQPVPLYTQLAISEYPNQNLGSAIGRSFNNNHKNMVLENLRFMVYSNYDTATFRINIYSLKRGKPNKPLLQTNIYKQITGVTKDWIQVNLKEYSIVVHDDFMVSIEWVDKSKKGNKLLFPLTRPSTASHFYKYGSQNKWKKFRAMSSLMQLKLKY